MLDINLIRSNPDFVVAALKKREYDVDLTEMLAWDARRKDILIENEAIKAERNKKSKEENGFKFMPLGQGLQDFAPIVDAVLDSNIEYVIYEKDAWYDACPFEQAKQSRVFLKEKFGI